LFIFLTVSVLVIATQLYDNATVIPGHLLKRNVETLEEQSNRIFVAIRQEFRRALHQQFRVI
jgi:hypothetical protein